MVYNLHSTLLAGPISGQREWPASRAMSITCRALFFFSEKIQILPAGRLGYVTQQVNVGTLRPGEVLVLVRRGESGMGVGWSQGRQRRRLDLQGHDGRQL
jgi:hypothetical protein